MERERCRLCGSRDCGCVLGRPPELASKLTNIFKRRRHSEPVQRNGSSTALTFVATDVSYCVTHRATDHDDGRAWTACRFRQLFYFDNPMDEHTVMWADEIGA